MIESSGEYLLRFSIQPSSHKIWSPVKSMRQLDKDLVCQMLGKEDRALSTVGRTQIEALARKGPEIVVATFRVGAADAGDALEIVAT